MTKKVKEIVFEAKYKRSVSDWIREIVPIVCIICGIAALVCDILFIVVYLTGRLFF